MPTTKLIRSRLPLLAILAVVATLGLAGCDDHVFYDRDSSIPIHRGMTWAWRPAGSPPTRSDRRVVSRDMVGSNREMGPNREFRRNPDWEHDIVRNRIAHAIEQNLSAKGLVQVGDPSRADFLVDFQFGVQRRRERVATPVYSPGLVCGYYGCWDSFYGGTYVHTIQYHEGTIVFDLFDQRSGRPAYHAVRENEVHRDSYRDAEVYEGAKHLLKGLKPS
jgi:hypothetical protein